MPNGSNELPPIYQQIGALTEAVNGLREDFKALQKAEIARQKRDIKLERRLATLEAKLESALEAYKEKREAVRFRDMDRGLKITIGATTGGIIAIGLGIIYLALELISKGVVHP